MMDIEEIIKKWDEQITLHRRVCDDPLMYTKEERLKNSHYAQAICAVVDDLKKNDHTCCCMAKRTVSNL